MLKKVAVVILIFILLAITPRVGELYNWFRDNTPTAVQAVSSTFGSAYAQTGNVAAEISSNVTAFVNQARSWFGSIPAMAPAATQEAAAPSTTAAATPSPSPSQEAAPLATPTPLPTPSATQAPRADLFGTIAGQTYTNESVGLGFDFPKGYEAQDENAIRENIVKDSPALKDAYTDTEKFNELVQAGAIPVFAASKHPYGYTGGYNSNMEITAQEITNQQITVKAMADILKQGLAKMKGYTSVQDPQTVTVGGAKGALVSATLTASNLKVSQKIYLLQNGSWFISITLCSTSKTELNEMTKALQTFRFTTPAVSAAPPIESVDSGTVAGQTYTNNTGGFSLGFPAGYTALTDPDAIKKYDLEVFDAYKSIYKDPDAVRQALEAEGTTTAFVAYRHPKGYKTGFNDEMNVSVIKMGDFNGSALDYAAYIEQSAAGLSDKIKMQNPEAVEAGGLTGAVVQSSFKIGSNTVNDAFFIFERSGYLITVDLSAVDETGMKELEQAFSSIKFLTGT